MARKVVVYEGAVYLEKNGSRTLHSRQTEAEQSQGVADEANLKAGKLGIGGMGTYVAVAEHAEVEVG